MIKMAIEELSQKLYLCYSKELCNVKDKNKWNENNRYFGMDMITSLVVNDFFSGDIGKINVNGFEHFFNIINGDVIDLTAKMFEKKIRYTHYEVIKRDTLLDKDVINRYNLLKDKLNNINLLVVEDILDIDNNKMFLHYTNIANLDNIIKKGLEPNIGVNAKVIEKTKKVFFSIGDKGALVIMDSWLKWLVAKPKSNLIYWIGAYLLNVPFFPKFIHKIIMTCNQKNKNKYIWAYRELNNILKNSIYLILNLEENIDFSYSDIDEVKYFSNFPKSYISSLYAHDSDINDAKAEYWNMHTFSNKIIDIGKISLLKYKNNYSADIILKFLIEKNLKYVKENCMLLYNYYVFIYKMQ